MIHRVENLTTLLAVTRHMAASTEWVPLLEAVVQAARQVLDCERATVFLYDACTDELYSKVATGARDIRFAAGCGIAGEAIRTGSVINVPDAYADPRFNREVDKQTGFRTRNLLTFRLTGYDGETVGVLQALNKLHGVFTPSDAPVRGSGSQVVGLSGCALTSVGFVARPVGFWAERVICLNQSETVCRGFC